MDILENVLWVLLVISSLVMIGLVLLHKGSGGGITDMFGGGISSGLQSSSVGERNLNRITWSVGVFWIIVVVLLGLIARFSF